MEAELEVNVAQGALETGDQEQAARRIVWVRLCGIDGLQPIQGRIAKRRKKGKNAAISAQKLRDTHSALMVHVHCAANNPCIKLSIVLGGSYMVIMEVEKEQNKTK